MSIRTRYLTIRFTVAEVDALYGAATAGELVYRGMVERDLTMPGRAKVGYTSALDRAMGKLVSAQPRRRAVTS